MQLRGQLTQKTLRLLEHPLDDLDGQVGVTSDVLGVLVAGGVESVDPA